MTSAPVLILCQSAKRPRTQAGTEVLELSHEPASNANIRLALESFYNYVAGDFQPLAIDLIRIASFVYAADTSVKRGGDTDVWGENWARSLHFRIPVLEPDRWNDPNVNALLIDCLRFLTGDSYQFEFEPWRQLDRQQYLKLFGTANEGIDADCISLFSGGLDSLCAVSTLAEGDGRKPLLIGHQSATRLTHRRQELVDALRQRGSWRYPLWTVDIHRSGSEARERTQRSRAFLYASLATAAGLCLGLREIILSDNGVTSLNIVYTKLSIGTELTRSTHPGFLRRLNALLRALDSRAPAVRNTLLTFTKMDVTDQIKNLKLQDLVPLTVSCSRTQRSTNLQPHCGTCSQCIDRRFAIEHSALAPIERVATYAHDIFLDDLTPGVDLTLVESFVRSAGDMSDISVDQFTTDYPEIWDAVSIEESTEDQVLGYHQLYRKHAESVLNVLAHKYEEHKAAIAKGTLPARCLLRLIPGERVNPVTRAARGIADTLRRGVPKAFQTTAPGNERAVQDAVDAVLAGYEDRFRREHPMIRFATKRFIPDFSPSLQDLSVEIKFPTKTRKLTAILNEIAASRMAHIASGRSILFLIYDYHHMITNDDEIEQDVSKDDAPYVFLTIVR